MAGNLEYGFPWWWSVGTQPRRFDGAVSRQERVSCSPSPRGTCMMGPTRIDSIDGREPPPGTLRSGTGFMEPGSGADIGADGVLLPRRVGLVCSMLICSGACRQTATGPARG